MISGGAKTSAPSPTWRTFLRNLVEGHRCDQHVRRGVRLFRLLYVLIMLAHDRRKIARTAVTEHPTAVWLVERVIDRFAVSVWIISSCSTSAIWVASCPYTSTTTNAPARIFRSIRIVPSAARSCPQGRKGGRYPKLDGLHHHYETSRRLIRIRFLLDHPCVSASPSANTLCIGDFRSRSGATVLTFRLQRHSPHRINSIAILAAAQIPVQRHFQ